MSFITWNDSFKTGVDQLDEHHRYLVELINKLYEDIETKADSEHFEALLDELLDYTSYHFNAEEYWMKANNCPDLARQEQEHYKFIKRVIEIRSDFKKKNVVKPLGLISFLKNWLTHHILEVDANYGRFVAKNL